MLKEKFSSLENFQEATKPYRLEKTNDGTVYFKDDFVYKIFDYSNFNEYFENIKNIKKVSRFNGSLFTIPYSFIYIDGDFVGFKMYNLGETLLDTLLNGDLSIDEKKEIGNSLKEIALYLRKRSLVHSDIHLKNILYKDGNIRITDINGIMKIIHANSLKDKYIRMLDLYYYWYIKYGISCLDYLEINFCTHILFNCSQEYLTELFVKKKYGSFSYRMGYLLDLDNTFFEDDVFKYFQDSFNQKRKTLDQHIYLIDHLK